MESFSIDVEWLDGPDLGEDRSSFAQIVLKSSADDLTELEDLLARTVRSGFRASSYDLAMWFAENWWRLRWEPEGLGADWLISHSMASVGGGYVWPDVTFASEGPFIHITAKRTKGSAIVPIRYLRDFEERVPAEAFEQSIDDFLDLVLARLSALKVGENDLEEAWSDRAKERSDPQEAGVRKLEALLGYDVYEAPSSLLGQLEDLTKRYGRDIVEEIASAERNLAPEAINDGVKRTLASKEELLIPDIDQVRKSSARYLGVELPWQRAARYADAARKTWGIDSGPVNNSVLSELLSVSNRYLESNPSKGITIAMAMREEPGAERARIVMRAKMGTGRRFEVMRLVADQIQASPGDVLFAATASKTARQKFQRAFAQEFLLPYSELRDRLELLETEDRPIEDADIEEVALEYQVSPMLVASMLVNRGDISRDQLGI